MNEETRASYTVSIHYDRRRYRHDIDGSIAHVTMLSAQGVITTDESKKIIDGLSEIRQEIELDTFQWKNHLEDIHMNIEARLFEKIGQVAGKLHTGRSRNDQVATDIRLYCKEAVQEIIDLVKNFQIALLRSAEANREVIIPGYTHLQRAQPVLYPLHMLAYFHMFQRDRTRFEQCYARCDVLPLGSGALAGVPYPIDRELVAKILGFGRISENSMDAVSDRDFIIDCQAASATCMMHLSRMAEELVLWSSQEFGFIRLDDGYTTGSSIMPQKRNPDFAELGRGKTGRIYGNLMGILTVLKGLPLTYNRDLQEDKEGLFDTVDTLTTSLDVFSGMVNTMKINEEATRQAAENSYVLATDLADYLVKRGESFRNAHGIVASLTKYADQIGKGLGQLDLSEYRNYSEIFEEDVYEIDIGSSIFSRDVFGGTSPGSVDISLKNAWNLMGSNSVG